MSEKSSSLLTPPSIIFRMAEEENVVLLKTEAKLFDGTPFLAQVPLFIGYQIPNGFLPPEPEAHALFMYNLMAYELYSSEILNPIRYEGDPYPGPDFLRIMDVICAWYSTSIERIVRFWEPVESQCQHLGLPTVPDEERYRFNKPGKVDTEEEVKH